MRTIVALVLGAGIAAAGAAEGEPPNPRHTETVRLVEACLPSVVALRCLQQTAPGVVTVVWGSGSVIHETGYILTNDHVVGQADAGDAVLPGQAPLPFRVVARLPHEDVALIKIDAPTPLRPLPLGRSDDLMLGEPTIVIGNPDGIAHTVSTGIISGLDRVVATPHAFLPRLVQTNAAVSGGSSGGPLINALGQQIGMVSGKRPGGENLNFAITVDHIRTVFPRLLAVEERFGFRLGFEAAMLDPEPRVTAVADGSPAARAGLRAGDVIRRIDGRPVAHGIDLQIALVERQPGQTLALELERDGMPVGAEVTLAALPEQEPVDAKGLVPGLRYAAFLGAWERLPEIATLSPGPTGAVNRVSLDPFAPLAANFAVRFSGFVKLPADGLYIFFTASDDGSRLFIGARLVVDNDGLHEHRESSGLVRLRAGLHPLTVDFFQGPGEKTLVVSVEGPNLKKRELPPEMLFTTGPTRDGR